MSKEYNVNHQIQAKKVDLVLIDGSLKEAIPLSEALFLAENENLDLVEVSPSKGEKLPVCKMMDYGKMMYSQNKKDKSNKHVQRDKEIKYSFNIDDHDLQVRHNKVKEFLTKHYIVRYVLELKGREKYMVEEAKKKFSQNLLDFEGDATWNIPLISGGRRVEISTTLHSK